MLRALFLIACWWWAHAATAACGTFPSTWPAWAGGELKVEDFVKVNGISVTKNEYNGTFGIAGSGTVQNVSLTMPSLDPATFPTIGAGSNLSGPVTVAPGTYATITVNNTAATPDTTFTGGGTYYIDTLVLAPLARAQLGPGDYFIRRIQMGNNSEITVTAGGVARVFVNSNISWGNTLRINQGGNAANFQLYLHSGVTEASLGNGTYLTGLVFAPFASQKLKTGQGSIYTGALYAAGELEFGDLTTITYSATVQAQIASITTCSAILLGRYRFDETAWGSAAGAILDSSGANRHASAVGTPLPTPNSTTPARAGNPGTCGYGVFPGPSGNGGAVSVTGLPVNTSAGGRNTVGFWLYWVPWVGGVVAGWNKYDLYQSGSILGFNSFAGDLYYASISGSSRWIHVVAVFSNGNESLSEIYINGVKQSLVMMGTPKNADAYATSSLLIGGMGATTSWRLSGANVDEVHVYSGALSQEQITSLYNETHPCPVTGPHHLEISDSTGGNGLTCSPSTLTIRACADAACSSLYTGGVSGTLTATPVSGSPTANWGGGSASFSIPAGSSSVTKTLQLTSVNSTVSATLGATSSASNPATCTFASCLYSASNAGFWFDIPHHIAATTQNVTVNAVRKSDNSNACVPAFANVSKTLQMACTYENPLTGTLPVVANGTALNPSANANAACASANAVTLNFNASGQATATFSYADVGQMGVTIAYAGSAATGDDGLSMNGTDSFIAAPKDILINGIPAAPLTAGTPFNTTVTVRNNVGAATPNFGRETTAAVVAVTSSNPLPGVGNAAAISDSFTAFAGGVSSRNLRWDEVGTITLNARVNNYLSSGIDDAIGVLTDVGRFKPAHFKTVVTQACLSGAYTYSGQPFPVRTTAYAATGAVTANYGGATWAKKTTLTADPLTTGTLAGGVIEATAFASGFVDHLTPAFTFSTPKTVPQSIAIRATDTDGVTSQGVPGGEGLALLRSGRLVLRSNYGSELLPLLLPLEAQFWQEGGNAAIATDDYWTINVADTCTTVGAAGVTLANFRPGADPGLKAGETSVGSVSGINAGRGIVTLTTPGATNSGSVNVEINTTTAGIPWLSNPPPAKATFGLRRSSVIHLRENF